MKNSAFLIAFSHCCTRFLKTWQTLKIVVLLKENDDFQQFAFSALSIFSIKKCQKSYSKSSGWKNPLRITLWGSILGLKIEEN